jgi:beta-mannosidase
MTDQSLALRLLGSNCLDLDPGTPFLPTAPLFGMGHGDYRFRDERGREIHEIFQSASNTAYTEFGCPAPAGAEELRRFIPAGELWPPRPGTAWEVHHAFGAWEADPGSWLFLATIERYFGPCASLEELSERGSWLQCAGYQAVFEEARRQKPRCSMALNWCFNEAWPTAAGNALVSWPATPKPSLEAARLACRPVLASARIRRFQWRQGETLEAELWILNDSQEAVPPGVVSAVLASGGKESHLGSWSHPGAPAGTNLRGPVVSGKVQGGGPEIELRLRAGPSGGWDSAYRLSLAPADT